MFKLAATRRCPDNNTIETDGGDAKLVLVHEPRFDIDIDQGFVLIVVEVQEAASFAAGVRPHLHFP